MNKGSVKGIRVIVFFIGVVGLLFIAQNVLKTEFTYPRVTGGSGEMLEEYYELADDVDFQAIFIGGSGFGYNIDPMRLYSDTGIATFTMSTGGQSMDARYALCQEVFKTQHPKVVVVDAGGVFSDSAPLGLYHYVLDHLPISGAKLQLASAYAEQFAKENGAEKKLDAFLGAVIPIYQYHDRWASLKELDFFEPDYGNLYHKGYYPCGNVWPTSVSLEQMDEMVQQLSQESGWQITVGGGSLTKSEDTGFIYEPRFNEDCWQIVLDIKQLCEKNGAKMLLMKMPFIIRPLYKDSVWTKVTSDILKERAAQEGIDFLDMQYDVDLGINWYADAGAGTQHLNWRGAGKVTAFLGDLLQTEYGVTAEFCPAYEKDIPIYDQAVKLIKLQLTDDLYGYFDALSAMRDITVFFSASTDMTTGLSDEICQALNGFGLQMDFRSLEYSDAYAAVMEDGGVLFETYSNRAIQEEGTLRNGSDYSLISKGYLIEAESSIEIDGEEYSRNARGLNIVVLDNTSGIVLDSVTFDMYNPNKAAVAVRTSGSRNSAFWEYDQYLRTHDPADALSGQLRSIGDLNVYLDALAQLDTERYSVFMAVKDIQGFCLTPEMTGRLKTLGFDQADTLLEWVYHSFVGVLSGDGVYQQIGTDLEPSHYEGTIRGIDVSVDSMVLEGGNTAAIVLDGQDYALNSRGINIVVYDHETDQVVDSTVFDTHAESIPRGR